MHVSSLKHTIMLCALCSSVLVYTVASTRDGTGSLGQRLWTRWVGSQVSVSDPVGVWPGFEFEHAHLSWCCFCRNLFDFLGKL